VNHRIILIIIVILSNFAEAKPTTTQIASEITDNISMEYAECAAYFSITSAALSSSSKLETAKKYDDLSNKAAIFALDIAKQSRNEEMATKVTLARIEMSLKDMRSTIDNNYSNYSLLSNKYMTPCIDAMRDPKPVIDRWAKKIQNKYEKTDQSKH
jgi:uncharacterized protein YegL